MYNEEFNNGFNGFNGFEPQKPFTENPPMESTEPQNIQNDNIMMSSISEAENNSSEEQHVPETQDEQENFEYPEKSPYNNEAYSDNQQFTNNGYQPPQYSQTQFNDYSNPMYRQGMPNKPNNGYRQQEYSYPQRNGNAYYQPYNSAQGYGYPQQQYQQQYTQQPQYPQQIHYQSPQCTQQVPQSVNYQNSGIPYAQVSPVFPKKKMNGGLIAFIIILVVLMLGSLIGLVAYVTYNNVNNTDNTGGYSFTTPYDSNGGIGNFEFPKAEDESEIHSESDYSEKTQSDYIGMQLNVKPSDAKTNSKYNTEYASDNVLESIVGIVCYSDEITSVEYADAEGSGIILTSDGYILTNAHVIGNSRTDYLIQVVTSDGKTHNAGVVGFDSRTDIAVLKADNVSGLKPASFGNSDETMVGEEIIVAANPGGLEFHNTITKGIVSAVDRELSNTSIVKYIQTDAAINPGSSGGALVNMYGQVIGVATLKIADEDFEGMAFAIPSKTVKEISDSIIRNSYVKGRVKIGISGTAVEDAIPYSDEYPDGIIISSIVSGGPCDGSGLKEYDIITKADGHEIDSFSDMYEILENHKAGDKIKLEYYRPGNKSTGTVEVILQEDK